MRGLGGTGDNASASGGRRWPIDSLEHALELELDIQEADMRLVRHVTLVHILVRPALLQRPEFETATMSLVNVDA